MRDRCYQNEKCQDHRKFSEGNIIRHSKYKTRQGRQRRYLYKTCETTFCSTKGTPYYRLHKSRLNFDEVVQMTVEGVGISSISRIKHQKTTQLSGNLFRIKNPFLVVFRVYENSVPSREVYVDSGLVTTVNEGSTRFLAN